MRSVALTAALVLFIATTGALADEGARVALPIHQQVNPSGSTIYWVQVDVEGTPLRLDLDTGSVGLRVLRTDFPKTTSFTNDGRTVIGYDDGVRLDGFLTSAKTTLGTLSQSVPIQIVETASCDPGSPKCLVANGKPRAAWWGLDGIIGISLAESRARLPLPNPLQGLSNAWIVELPEPGSKVPGQLVLNPSPDDLTGFVEFPSGTGGARGSARDNPIPGCLKNDRSGESFCGNVIFDTGKPGVSVVTDAKQHVKVWPGGSPAELSLTVTAAQGPVAKFIVKPDVWPTRVYIGPFPEMKAWPGDIFAGAEPYLGFDVLYDAANEKLGVRPR